MPVPSYPLFELLSRLEAVDAVPYPLDAHGGWSYDVEAIAARVTPRTRAVVVVSPNNPTGTVLTAAERPRVVGALRRPRPGAHRRRGLRRLSRRRRAGPDVVSSLTLTCLAVSLGGLSKAVGLPQLKLAWMAIAGPPAEVEALVAGLELVADTYPLGRHAGAGGPAGAPRARRRRARSRSASASCATSARCGVTSAVAPEIQLLEPSGGWTAVLRVPATRTEEDVGARFARATSGRRPARLFLRLSYRGVAGREPAGGAGRVRARHRADRGRGGHGI